MNKNVESVNNKLRADRPTMSAGAPARCPLIAVKLNGATAAQKPCIQHMRVRQHNFSNNTCTLGTVLNLKGLNSCLDLVGGDQHRDIFLQPAARDQDIK